MHDRIKRVVLRILKVPPEPQAPSGSPDSIRMFRAAPNYYAYSLVRWALKQVGAFAGIVILLASGALGEAAIHVPWDRLPLPDAVKETLAGTDAETGDGNGASRGGAVPVFFWLEVFGLVVLVCQLPLTYAMVRLDYEMRWYIATDRSLRIREGIGTVREMTMTFANVQNLTIEQGPLQRMLGISDLRVRTAGGGSGESDSDRGDRDKDAGSLHVGYLRGLGNAEEIRDLVLSRLRRLRDSGLGDPDDDAGPGERTPLADLHGPVAAARGLLDEVRALRAALGPGPG